MQTDHQDSHSLSHAGHGQVVTLQQALYANSQHGGLATPITSANLPSSSSSSSIPGVPGLGTGYPLYRDTSGQLHLSDVGQAQAIASVQARRPSVSQQPRKIRSSRNHPYALRAPSGSVSSVASNASSHHSSTSSHHGNNTGTSSVFYSVSGSNPSYSDLSAAAVLAGPASRGDDLNNGSSHDATAWNTGNCIHSRSSSFSSVSSEFSSSSQTSSSGWSDVVDPNDTSAATPNTSATGGRAYNTPYNGTIGDGAIHYVHTATTYYGSPAMQVSDLGLGHPLTTQQRSVSTGNVGTTSLACLDGALDANLTDLIPHYHQQQTQPGRVYPSAGSMFPVLLQPVPGASISSQSLSPMDRMNGRNGTNAHGSFNMPMGFDQAGMPASSFTDASLGSLADAIRKTAGSSTTTEKAKINFVHGWLKQSFVLHPEGNISRHALYNAYIHICKQYGLPPINAASYGKAVRSCWPGIKTRRLGVRGASRYHYCGIKATNEITKEIVEYYNGFEAGTGKSIICEYDGNSTGSTNGAGVEFCGAYGHEEEQEESYGQDGLVAHMGGLHGLGGDEHVSSSYQTSSVQDLNELGSITLYRPGMFNQQHQHQMHPQQQLRHGMKLERSDSTFSSPIDVMNRRPSTSSSYSDVSHHPSVSAFAPLDSSASLDGPAMLLNGPFAGGNIVPTPPGQQHQQLRRQLSAPTSLREQMIQDSNDINMSQQQQQQYQDMPEISFGDLKTPTAFHFMQQGNAATHAQMQKVIYSSGASASSITSIHSTGIQHSFVKDLNSNSLLAVPRAHRLTPDSQGGGTPGDGTPTPCNGLEQASEGQKSLAAAKASPQLLGQTSSAAMSAGRSASIPNTSTHPSAIDTFALRFKGRRATLPDLHIRIPPSSRNPPSASSNLSKGSSAAGKSISEEKEANMNTTDADADGEGEEDEDEDEDDQMYEDKKTARLIPRSDYQENQQASLPMLDIPLPSFQEIIQAFSARLVGSPNHPGGVLARQLSANSRESSSSGSASRNVDNTTFSANDVIAARNASMAVLKNLDMGHAEAVWELYRTSHCRGLLRLAQQGKLDEFEGAFLLFWSQLDAAQQALVQHPVLNEAMYQADALLYPFLLTQLSERILLSTTADEANTRDSDRTAPVDLTKLVHISRNLEEWTLAAFESYPDGFADCRVELASRTAHLLGRFAGVARLAQALGGILQEPESVDTLIKAWESLDFDAILNQSALVTGCLQDTIQSYFDTFYAVLKEAKIGTDGSIDQQEQQSSGSIHRFLLFADDILERYVSDSAELSTRLNGSGSSISESKYQQADESFLQSTLKVDERAFLMKWSYLTGQILRELTITSSPAFGTFQIMCLFLEEYLSFKILKNFTLRSDNISASIDADSELQAGRANASHSLPSYCINTGNGDAAKGINRSSMDIVKEQENAAMAFLVSPQAMTHDAAAAANEDKKASPTSYSNANSQDGQKQSSQIAIDGEFTIPPGQPSANAFTTAFNLSSSTSSPSNTSLNTLWSPTTRAFFSEFALSSATSSVFPRNSSSSVQLGSESILLPPPTPSAFSSFPSLKSPGLSRYFPSSSTSSTTTTTIASSIHSNQPTALDAPIEEA